MQLLVEVSISLWHPVTSMMKASLLIFLIYAVRTSQSSPCHKGFSIARDSLQRVLRHKLRRVFSRSYFACFCLGVIFAQHTL
uniref:Uncharacterized protein n=1 Tax=Arundo donax TaxID=35708 RepID=A0A0A9CLH6_ARUDO